MTSFERLLAAIAFEPGRDDLWLVGDLVNRGPRSLDVLRWVRDHESCVTAVLGNHDLHLLARAAGVAPEKKRDTLAEVLAAPDLGRLLGWLRRRPFVHEAGEFALVHAGLHSKWTIAESRDHAAELEEQLRGPRYSELLASLGGGPVPKWDPSLSPGPERWRALLAYLVRVRTVRLADGRVESDFDGHPGDAPDGCIAWFAMPDPAWATRTVVFGHWAALGLDLGPHHMGLDTGCVWGGSLTAVRLDEGRQITQITQVRAVDEK